MKKTALTITLAGIALIMISCGKNPSEKIAQPAATGEGTQWYTFTEGFPKAKKEKKPMVIDFYADWCKWCKVMEKDTFGDTAVIKKLEKDYIPIRIRTDRPGSERIKLMKHDFSIQEFSAMLGVQGLPTLVFMDPSGKPITKIPGYVKKEVFLPLLSYITEKCYQQNVPFEAYLKGNVTCKK